MTKIDNIEELHKILLDIAKDFHQVCVENNIPYYMLGGTMLGAVRHKGFIPWDDDMDFGVERKYFEKLEQIYAERKGTPYRLRTRDNSKTIFNDFDKLEDTRTLIFEPARSNIKEDLGINIDVFPLDITNGKRGIFSRNRMVRYIAVINSLKYRSFQGLKFRTIIKAIIFRIVFFPFSKIFLLNFAKRYLIPGKGDYLSNLYGFWGTREVVPNDVMGEPTLYQFEDIHLYGPEKFDEYLSILYGDYMRLPPEDSRHIHLNKAYIK